MRLIIYIFVISILFYSCQGNEEKVVEGDLYFKLFDMDKYFDTSDSALTGFENNVKEINPDTLNRQDRKVYEAFKFMVDNNLLRRPYIHLRLDNGDIRILSLDSLDYQQFAKYRWSDLDRSKRKVRIKIVVTEFDYPLFLIHETETAYKGLKVLSINDIEGKTYWEK